MREARVGSDRPDRPGPSRRLPGRRNPAGGADRGEQRDRRDPAAGAGTGAGTRPRAAPRTPRPLPHRRGAGPVPRSRGSADRHRQRRGQRAQAGRTGRRRRPVAARRGAVRAAHPRRRTGRRTPRGNRERGRHHPPSPARQPPWHRRPHAICAMHGPCTGNWWPGPSGWDCRWCRSSAATYRSATRPTSPCLAAPGVPAEVLGARAQRPGPSTCRAAPPAPPAATRSPRCCVPWASPVDLAGGAFRVSVGWTTSAGDIGRLLEALERELPSPAARGGPGDRVSGQVRRDFSQGGPTGRHSSSAWSATYVVSRLPRAAARARPHLGTGVRHRGRSARRRRRNGSWPPPSAWSPSPACCGFPRRVRCSRRPPTRSPPSWPPVRRRAASRWRRAARTRASPSPPMTSPACSVTCCGNGCRGWPWTCTGRRLRSTSRCATGSTPMPSSGAGRAGCRWDAPGAACCCCREASTRRSRDT